MNNQRSNKETCTEFSPSHVRLTTNAHEEVWNGKPSIQEDKEATGQQ